MSTISLSAQDEARPLEPVAPGGYWTEVTARRELLLEGSALGTSEWLDPDDVDEVRAAFTHALYTCAKAS